MKKVYLSIACLCMGWTVEAQDSLKTVELDEVVITGTKSEIPIEKSGKSIYKISRKDIESSSAATVPDLLNEVPGIQMDGNYGPMGTNIDYFVRGAQSKRTLVLIDGVPFNDPSGIDQTYDLRLLDLNQVESIEVLKGGLSTLYGTGAAAGVINIRLKEAAEEVISGKVGSSYGSFNTTETSAGLSGKNGAISYMLTGSYKQSDGFSAASDSSDTGSFDSDGFEGYNFLGKVGYTFSDAFQLHFIGAYDAFDTEIDAGAFTDAADDFSDYEQVRFGLQPRLNWTGGSLRADLFSNRLNRFFYSFGTENTYDASNYQADIVVEQALAENLKFIGGMNYQHLSYAQDQGEEERFYLLDPYATFIFEKSGLNLQLGARLNHHSEYGNNFVFNVNPSYLIDTDWGQMKVYGSYATAFITPSLYQLFGPFGANPELSPESSESMELGAATYLSNLSVDMVYFYRKDDDLILFTDSYVNANEGLETDGIEVAAKYQVAPTLAVRANYTFTRRYGTEAMFRIPRHKYGASLSYEPVQNLLASVSYLRTGGRDLRYFDSNIFETVQVVGDPFSLVDVNLSYEFGGFKVSGAIRNLLDEEYQAIVGFNSIGRNYRLGIVYRF